VQQNHNAERQGESQSIENAEKIICFFVGLGNHGLKGYGQNASSGEGGRHRFEQIIR